MNKKIPFQFAVLRYMHDPLTEEFLNVGVVLYAREIGYLEARISSRYSRLSDAFASRVDGDYYRRLVNHIDRQITTLQQKLQSRSERLNLYEWPAQIEMLLAQVLPEDDSSLVFGGYGGGLSPDLASELAHLYTQLVEKYQDKGKAESRSDDEVWDISYKPYFVSRRILTYLEPAVLTTPTYRYEFRYGWKNERYHPIEPVSFDMVRAHSIRSKTSRWIGNAQLLSKSPELGTLYLLVGKPSRESLIEEYQNAVLNLKNQIRIDHKVIEEGEAEEFSKDLAHKIDMHAKHPEGGLHFH